LAGVEIEFEDTNNSQNAVGEDPKPKILKNASAANINIKSVKG